MQLIAVSRLRLALSYEAAPNPRVDRTIIMHLTSDNGAHWVAVWASMPQLTEPDNHPPSPFVSPSVTIAD